jgi:5-methyltetrahydrofolate--homocysteine methyltransferase
MNWIEEELKQRILVLDGAMATMIQPLGLKEEDFRTRELTHHAIELKGNNDLLNLTRPNVIRHIHQQYLDAGADILSTNTFGANRISQSDYDLENLVYEMNYQGARLAKQAVWAYKRRHDFKPLFVAGSIGPTTKMASLSSDVTNPGFRAVTFDQLKEAYEEQACALIDGGVDLFLLETITDTINAKAALMALMSVFEKRGRRYPIMVSGTITDASGRILSGQTIEAFIISISHAPLLSIGLNCALGAKELRPYIEVLHKESPFFVSTHPNAGLPNQFGSYDQSAQEFAELVGEFAGNGWLNIVGGCCGTTPAHIAAAAKAVNRYAPRKKPLAGPSLQKWKTSYQTSSLIERWKPGHFSSGPVFSMTQLIDMVSRVEDRPLLDQIKLKFSEERSYYHPEQARLVNAHVLARYQWLQHKGTYYSNHN